MCIYIERESLALLCFSPLAEVLQERDVIAMMIM